MAYIEGVFLNAPVWVWPLLALLLWLGWRSSKRRRSPVLWVYALPLLGVMSVPRIVALSGLPMGGLGYAAGLGIGTILGWLGQRRWLLEKSGWSVTLAGEWYTLLAMMVIYWSNFAEGVLRALDPAALEAPWFAPVMALAIALPAGFFLGRAAWTLMASSAPCALAKGEEA